jgi:hypothetical protein
MSQPQGQSEKQPPLANRARLESAEMKCEHCFANFLGAAQQSHVIK